MSLRATRLWLSLVPFVALGATFDPTGLWAQSSKRDQEEPTEFIAKELAAVKGHDREVNCLAFHPGGGLLISGGHEGAYITWDLSAFLRKRKEAALVAVARAQNSDHISAIDFSDNGNVLACSGVTRWGNGFGSNLALFTPYRKDSYGIGCDCAWSWTCTSVHPQGMYVAAGSLSRQVRVISLLPKRENGKAVPSLDSKNATDIMEEVWRIDWHPDGSVLAAAGRGGWIQILELKPDGLAPAPAQVAGHAPHGVTGLKFAPDGKRLVSVGHDRRLRVWSLANGRPLGEFGETVLVSNPEWCDLHRVYPWALIACEDGSAVVINYETGSILGTIRGHSKLLKSAVFHPNGNWVATAGTDFQIKLWDLGFPEVLPKRTSKRK